MKTIWELVSITKINNKISKVDWDERLPKDVLQTWRNFAAHLKILNEITIARYLFPSRSKKICELHGFSEASQKTYGATIYIRALHNNRAHIKLLFSKNKIRPIKDRTTPQLEFCGALLSAEQMKISYEKVLLKYSVAHVGLWTDASIMLLWLRKSSASCETFVANRVQKIQTLSQDFVWDHVSTSNNPADVLSCGI